MLDFAEDNGPLERRSKSRKRRIESTVVDAVTTLPSDMLKAWQLNYATNMKQLRTIRSTPSSRTIAKKNAESLTWAYGGAILHPHLQSLFCKSSRAMIESDKVDKSRGADTGIPAAMSALSNDLNVEAPLQDNPNFKDDVELGRRAVAEDYDMPSVNNSVFPWNLSREGSLLRSFSAVHGTGQDTLATQTTPRQFSFVPTPTLRSRQNSAIPSKRQSGLGLLERLDSVDAPGMKLV